jgi:phosphoribosylanthranilate isomerase
MSRIFVSVSGISNRKELEEIGKIYRNEKLKFNLAIGYQVSGKSINDGTRNPRQPFFSDLKGLCDRTLELGFIPAIHYYAKSMDWFNEDVEKIAGVIEPERALIQFNTLPLSIEALGKVKERGFGVIFKVAVANKKSPEGGYKVWKGEMVQDVTNGDASLLIKQIEERKGLIDYAMFDPSHGTNLELDLSEKSLAIRFGRELVGKERNGCIGLVYAGGIGPGNVKEVAERLNHHFPWKFSIDTESGVRTNNELDIGLVRNYLVNYRDALK